MMDGDLIPMNGHGYVVSPAEYDDFELKLEFWADESSNSGVFFRCGSAKNIGAGTCYEANIFDSRPDQSGGTGAIVGVAPPSQTVTSEGQWNTYVIRAEGEHLSVILNGIQTVDVLDNKFSNGFLSLQFASGGLKFRNVTIRDL
jgi:hypothetical protein